MDISFEVNVDPLRMYDLLVTGVESPYSSVLVAAGNWGQAWQDADKGAHNAFGLITLVDRYAVEEGDDFEGKRMHDTVLIEGLKIMARDYKSHFADFMNENDDAITGDVFVQCVMFGEVIYG